MSLKDRASKARRAQTFDSSISAQQRDPEPAKRPTRQETPAQKQGNAKKPPKMAVGEETANARARATAGVRKGVRLSRAEQQAIRRRELAQLSIELSEDRKAELLAAAADNNRSLKDEVLHRLFGE